MRKLVVLLLFLIPVSLASVEVKNKPFTVAFYPDWYTFQEYFVVDRIDTLDNGYVRLSYQGKIIGCVSHQSLKKVTL